MKRVRNIPLTRRGWTVVGMIIGSIALGLLFGARSLNAVVAPAVLAVVVAIWHVSRFEFPPLRRVAPRTGTVGEHHSVEIGFGDQLEQIGSISEEVSDQLTVSGNETTVPLERGLTYELELSERGRFILGPATVTVSDILGLTAVSRTYPNRSEVTVYPQVHPVRTPALERIAEAANITLARERHEFDRLREYRPTDSLRDIHWKSSAKRTDDEFIVKEFVSVQDRGAVIISGESVDGADDALAQAIASLSSALVEDGVRVGVLTTHGSVDPIRNRTQFDRILTNLALLEAGTPRAQAEIHLVAESDDLSAVKITVNDYEFTMGELLHGGQEEISPEDDLPLASTGEVAD